MLNDRSAKALVLVGRRSPVVYGQEEVYEFVGQDFSIRKLIDVDFRDKTKIYKKDIRKNGDIIDIYV